MKENENVKTSLKLRRILDNNLFILKIIQKAAPFRILIEMGSAPIIAILNFLTGTYLLRYIVNGLQDGTAFQKLLIRVA